MTYLVSCLNMDIMSIVRCFYQKQIIFNVTAASRTKCLFFLGTLYHFWFPGVHKCPSYYCFLCYSENASVYSKKPIAYSGQCRRGVMFAFSARTLQPWNKSALQDTVSESKTCVTLLYKYTNKELVIPSCGTTTIIPSVQSPLRTPGV